MLGAASRDKMADHFGGHKKRAMLPRTPQETELNNIIFNPNNPYDRFGNVHCWVVLNGKIYDPTPLKDFMKLTGFLAGLDLEKPYYEAYCPEKCQLLHKLAYMKWQRCFPEFQEQCYKDPQVGSCYYNALAFCLKNPTALIQFGKMGYKIKGTNEVFIEWGETNPEVYERHSSLIMNKFKFCAKRRNKTLGKLLRESPRDDEEIQAFRAYWKDDKSIRLEQTIITY